MQISKRSWHYRTVCWFNQLMWEFDRDEQSPPMSATTIDRLKPDNLCDYILTWFLMLVLLPFILIYYICRKIKQGFKYLASKLCLPIEIIE